MWTSERPALESARSAAERVFSLGIRNVTGDDAGVYACFIASSLMDMDKTLRYNSAVLEVEMPKTGRIIRFQ